MKSTAFGNKASGVVVEPAYASIEVKCFSSEVPGGAVLVAPGTPTTPLDEEELVLLWKEAGTVFSELIEETNGQLCLLTFETGVTCVTPCVSRATPHPLCPGRLMQRPCLPGTQSPHDLPFLQQEQFLHVAELLQEQHLGGLSGWGGILPAAGETGTRSRTRSALKRLPIPRSALKRRPFKVDCMIRRCKH